MRRRTGISFWLVFFLFANSAWAAEHRDSLGESDETPEAAQSNPTARDLTPVARGARKVPLRDAQPKEEASAKETSAKPVAIAAPYNPPPPSGGTTRSKTVGIDLRTLVSWEDPGQLYFSGSAISPGALVSAGGEGKTAAAVPAFAIGGTPLFGGGIVNISEGGGGGGNGGGGGGGSGGGGGGMGGKKKGGGGKGPMKAGPKGANNPMTEQPAKAAEKKQEDKQDEDRLVDRDINRALRTALKPEEIERLTAELRDRLRRLARAGQSLEEFLSSAEGQQALRRERERQRQVTNPTDADIRNTLTSLGVSAPTDALVAQVRRNLNARPGDTLGAAISRYLLSSPNVLAEEKDRQLENEIRTELGRNPFTRDLTAAEREAMIKRIKDMLKENPGASVPEAIQQFTDRFFASDKTDENDRERSRETF